MHLCARLLGVFISFLAQPADPLQCGALPAHPPLPSPPDCLLFFSSSPSPPQSFRAVQTMETVLNKNGNIITTGSNDASDSLLSDHLLPDDLSPRLHRRSDKPGGGSRAKAAQAGHWASALETRIKIGCLRTIVVTGVIWGIATIVLRYGSCEAHLANLFFFFEKKRKERKKEKRSEE